jgi:hypothetical protein
MDWGIPYTIKNILEFRCLKWNHMTHLGIWNTSYDQEKGGESNWQFDFWPLKIKNRFDFLAWKWCATYHWKAIDEGYNFALDLISIGGLHAKLWAPNIVGILVVGISRLALGSPEIKWHLGVHPVGRHRVDYKGESGGFPQI